jgi:hypothetical protein
MPDLSAYVLFRFAAISPLILFSLSCSPEISIDQSENNNSLALSRPYLGQTPPRDTPVLFAPGTISTGIHDDGAPRFSSDGRTVYFRKYAVPHDIVGYMKEIDGVWTKPELFKPFGNYVFSVPIFIPEAQSALFISRMPKSGEGETADYAIWQAEIHGDRWVNLKYIDTPLNTPDQDYAYSVSANGTLYLQAMYEDSLGMYDFYYSELIDGSYQKAVNMGAPLNTEFSESAPYISPDESFLVYCAYGYDDTMGGIDLYVSFRNETGTWSEGINLGEGVNSKFDDKFPTLSPDGEYLFFVTDRYSDRSYVFSDMTYEELMDLNLRSENGLGGDVYWVSTDVITSLDPKRAN